MDHRAQPAQPVCGDQKASPSACVVVCTLNRPVQLDRCPHQVIIVDNAPVGSSARDLAAKWGADYVREPTPGLSRARNTGARACRSDVIVYVDDDAVPNPGWLRALTSEFADPSVMVVTGRIRNHSRIAGNGTSVYMLGGDQRRVVDKNTPRWFEMSNFGGVGNGGNMAFRRDAFDVWPGFDPRLGRGALVDCCEEHYAFFLLVNSGCKVVYTPEALVDHEKVHRSQSELRDRYLRNRRAASAYATLLFAEQPAYRKTVIKYVAEAVIGKRRTWQSQTDLAASPSLRWRALLAKFFGCFLYMRTR